MPKRSLQGVVVSDKQSKTGWCASSAANPSLFKKRAPLEEIYAHDEEQRVQGR